MAVIINGRSAVHKESGGKLITQDICYTGPTRQAVTYTNVAKSEDAREYLLSLSSDHYPDVIYVDPMFPDRRKSALVKKEMQWLQDIVGADEDATELFALALTHAKKRIVVKRPRLAPPLSVTAKPHHSLKGKSIRFDIYLPAN